MSTAPQVPTTPQTLGDTVAMHFYQRLANLGVLSKKPLLTPLSVPAPRNDTPDAVAMGDHIKAETYRIAAENQRYYLLEASRSGKPWFHNPKHLYQYSEFVLITPEMAEELEKYNKENRRKSQPAIEGLARDMANGRWLQTEESLGVDINGDFYQGQHRTAAVRLAGIPVPLYTTFQVPPTARFVVDSGRKRQAKQKLEQILGSKVVKSKTTAICRAMMDGVNRSNHVITESEIGAFLLKHEDVISWVGSYLGSQRSDVQAAVAKAALFFGKERIQPFCERFSTVTGFHNDDPVRAAYKWVNGIKGRSGVQPVMIYRKMLHSLLCFVYNRPCINLIERKKDIFEWGPDWSVPNADTVSQE